MGNARTASRRTVSAVLSALLLPLILLWSPGPAAADDGIPRPANGEWQILGHGYGHGRGMSQWGAYGAANQGIPYASILSGYYPGTDLTGYPNQRIRVGLTLDTSQLRVAPSSGLVLVDGTGNPTELPASYLQWRLLVVGGSLQLQGLTSSWIAYPPGTPWNLGGNSRFENVQTGIVRAFRPDNGSTGYRGALFALASGSSIQSVLHLNMEDYLKGVVPRESPSSWPAAALQAQAVAARTYAAYAVETHKSSQTDICDTTQCQVFGGTTTYPTSGSTIQMEYASTNSAIQATSEQILTYQGGIAFAQFSSSNGGWSTAGTQPYLVAKADPWDGTAPGDPVHSWNAKIRAQDLEAAYPQVGSLVRLVVTSRDGNGEWGGRVKTIRLVGTAASVDISGAAFMNVRPYPSSNDGLRSSWFQLVPDPVPFGYVDEVGSLGDEGIHVGGWTIDPDTAAPIQVHVYVDGAFAAQATANLNRPDIANAYPDKGPNHGYDLILDGTPGVHTVCVYGINVGPGSGNSTLGCRALSIRSSRPFGSVDDASRSGDTDIRVAGWTIDPDTTSPIPVHIYVDGAFAGAVLADQPRSDVGAAYPGFGDNHGFVATVPSTVGAHTACAYGINTGPGKGNQVLGCRTVTIVDPTPIGALDAVARVGGSNIVVGGWALDPDTASSISVHAYVDGVFATAGQANESRPDIAQAYPGYGESHGYNLPISSTPGTHQVCVYGINVGRGTQNGVLGCRSFTLP